MRDPRSAVASQGRKQSSLSVAYYAEPRELIDRKMEIGLDFCCFFVVLISCANVAERFIGDATIVIGDLRTVGAERNSLVDLRHRVVVATQRDHRCTAVDVTLSKCSIHGKAAIVVGERSLGVVL